MTFYPCVLSIFHKWYIVSLSKIIKTSCSGHFFRSSFFFNGSHKHAVNFICFSAVNLSVYFSALAKDPKRVKENVSFPRSLKYSSSPSAPGIHVGGSIASCCCLTSRVGRQDSVMVRATRVDQSSDSKRLGVAAVTAVRSLCAPHKSFQLCCHFLISKGS